MRLPHRTTICMLFALLCLNYTLRYPWIPHEIGYDGFVFHGMVVSLVEGGFARWVVHPFSYMGLYPLSHPSGSIFLVASLTDVAGVPVEGTILMLDWILVVVGLMGGFILSMEIRRNEALAVLVAAFLSLSPRFVTGLMWEIPTRTMFAALVPWFMWFLLRWHQTRERQWLVFVPLVLLLMMTAHRLTVLMAAVLVAFILTIILIVMAKTLRIHYASRMLTARFRRFADYALLVAFLVVTGGLFILGDVMTSYGSGRLEFGSGVLSGATNLVVSLARSVGFLMPVMPIGVVAVYRLRGKGFKEPFLLMILLVLIPTLSLRQYTGYYVITFTAVFIGVGVWWIVLRFKNRATRFAIVAAALSITVASAIVVVQFDLQFDPFMDDVSYTHGLYIRHATSGTVIANDGVLGSKLFLVSGHPLLPVGGVTTAFQSPELLIFGFVDRSSMSVIQIPLSDLTVESDSPFVLLNVQAEADWAGILDHSPQAIPSQILATYSPTYVVENQAFAGAYQAYGKNYPSPFLWTMHAGYYKVFEVQGQTLWYFGGA